MAVRYCFLKFIFFLLVVFQQCLYAQSAKIETIKTFYKVDDNYVKESVYLHLPKLIFWENETIWFSGYVYDSYSKKPSLKTANVYCGIYDASGQQITKEIFYVENGKFHGQLRFHKKYGTGKFYIKAHTNWMKNFPDVKPYLQDIYIINKDNKTIPKSPFSFDIDINPEGGKLLNDIQNAVSVELNLSGLNNALITRCEIINQKNEVIVKHIAINTNGKGKFYFSPKQGDDYNINVILDSGQQLLKALPKALDIGYSVAINSLMKDNVVVDINTNKATLMEQANSLVYVAIHNKKLHNILRVNANRLKNTTTIPKSNLMEGVNVLTFYDNDLNIIAERKVYNETIAALKKTTANIKVLASKNDSLNIKITTNLINKKNSSSYLSIAVLPKASFSANENINLFNWASFMPYLSETSINKLQNNTLTKRQRLYSIDLLLMNNKIKTTTLSQPEPTYKFEKGFTVKGNINNSRPLNKKNLFAYQKGVDEFFSTQLDYENHFSLNNIYLLSNEDLNLSVDGENNLNSDDIDLSIYPMILLDSLSTSELKRHTSFSNTSLNQKFGAVYDSIPPSLLNASNVLDEVVIKATKKVETTRNPSLNFGIYESEKIGEDERRKYPMLSTYVRRLGFRVMQNFQNNTFSILPKSTAPFIQPPIVFLDGFREQNSIQDFSMASVDEIYYEHMGVEGSNGGTIYIYTRVDYSDDKKAVAKKKINSGYTLPEPFEYPSYQDYSLKDFLSYGLVYWNPNIQLDADGNFDIKFPRFNLNDFIIQINGFTTDGEFISIDKVININN